LAVAFMFYLQRVPVRWEKAGPHSWITCRITEFTGAKTLSRADNNRVLARQGDVASVSADRLVPNSFSGLFCPGDYLVF
jgi:hypothetical protein